ncbi:hypothetical protein [Acuticoccus sediminis]|uniref:hypothetical protein n=1 Tax=Acuticoccus sediminis TaxID=2184697 RepID=UPI001CFDF4DD|nr:hypothetical protein [Acuticoccus sediminis]
MSPREAARQDEAADLPDVRRARAWNTWIGIALLVLAAVCLLVWFPRDIGSGFVARSISGRIMPADAFFPTILVSLMVPLALLLILTAQRRGPRAAGGEPVGRITAANALFLLQCAVLIGASLAVMTVVGPLLVRLHNALAGTPISGYRAVSATFPYDVSGFFLGGTLMAVCFIALARRTLRWRDVAVAAASVAGMILIFDLLLGNILLPPNGDL